MSESKGGLDLSALQAGAKKLREVEQPAPSKAEGKSSGDDDEAIQAYVDLYTRFDGDLDRLFDHLGENPGKAKKYPPKSAREFGAKYYAGEYTYADAQRAEAK